MNSDLRKKLLDDLRLRKRKMAATQCSEGATSHFSRGSQRNAAPHQLQNAVESGIGPVGGSSNRIVLYKDTQTIKQQIRNMPKAIVFAFQNMINLSKMASSGSSTSFFSRFKQESVIINASNSVKDDNRSLSMYTADKGVEKLKQTMKESSNEVNFDGIATELVEHLVKGEVNFEEALRRLVNQQDEVEWLWPPRFSFDSEPKKPASETKYKFLHLGKDFRDSVMSSNTKSGGQNGRICIAVARLMGLEPLPLNNDKVDINSQRSKPQKDEAILSLNLSTVRKTDAKEGKNSGIQNSDKCLRNAEDSKLKHREQQLQKQSEKPREAVVSLDKDSKPQNRNRNMDAGRDRRGEITMPSTRSPQLTNRKKMNKKVIATKKQEMVMADTSTEAGTTKQQSEGFLKSREQQIHLTEDENKLKEVVINSQVLLNTAEALFNLDIPIKFLNQKDESGNKANLIIDCTYEMMKRRAKKHEASLHPYNPIGTLVSSKFESLEEMVKELCKEMDALKFYGRPEAEDMTSYLCKMVEREFNSKDYEWNMVSAILPEEADTVRELEIRVLNGLLNELTYDLAPAFL